MSSQLEYAVLAVKMEGDLILIDEIATKIAKHKIIPFVGAGCSAPILNIDWDGIVSKMKSELSSESDGHLEIAQDFVEKRGKEALCHFLNQYFSIEKFDDEKGYSYLALMSMGIKLIYTTNQDNVFETCMKKYGRAYRKIVKLDDLASAEPGDNLFVKFHGDLSIPDSVVFAKSDYGKRMETSNYFLDIKIRADLLGKSLLFVGYSFRDDNVRLIFKELMNAFQGELPKSYLIAYKPSEELERVCSEFSIECISPTDVFKGYNEKEAFEKYLYELVEKAFLLKTESEIENLFYSKTPPMSRVINSLEIEILKNILSKEDLTVAIKKFRAKIDRTLIPKDLEEEAVLMFCEMCRRCDNNNINELHGAAHNLILSEKKSRLEVYIHLMAIGNRYIRRGSMDIYHVTMSGMPEQYGIVLIAMAIEKLKVWGDEITDVFREFITRIVDYSVDYNELSEDERKYVKEQLDYAWKTQTTYEHPLKRQKRLLELGHPIPRSGRNFDSIMESMMSSLPKTFRAPYEE